MKQSQGLLLLYMPEISRFYGIIIRMFYNDHNPPHFHAIYQDYEALIDISTFDIIKGELPKRALALVLEWAHAHKKELLDNWGKARIPSQLSSIEPLK